MLPISTTSVSQSPPPSAPSRCLSSVPSRRFFLSARSLPILGAPSPPPRSPVSDRFSVSARSFLHLLRPPSTDPFHPPKSPTPNPSTTNSISGAPGSCWLRSSRCPPAPHLSPPSAGAQMLVAFVSQKLVAQMLVAFAVQWPNSTLCAQKVSAAHFTFPCKRTEREGSVEFEPKAHSLLPLMIIPSLQLPPQWRCFMLEREIARLRRHRDPQHLVWCAGPRGPEIDGEEHPAGLSELQRLDSSGIGFSDFADRVIGFWGFIFLLCLLILPTFVVMKLIDDLSMIGILLICLPTVFELILRSSIYVPLLFLTSYYLRVFGLVPGYHFPCYPPLPPRWCPLDFFKSAEGIPVFLPVTRTLSSLRIPEFRNRIHVILLVIPIMQCIYQCDSFVLTRSSSFVVALYMLGDFEEIRLTYQVDHFTSNSFDLLPRRTNSEDVFLCHLSMYSRRLVSSPCIYDVHVVCTSVLCNCTISYYY